MKKTLLALGTAAGLGAALFVGPSASATAGIHVHLSTTAPSAGQVVHVKATNLHAGEQYVCILAIGHRHITGSQSLADINTAIIKPASSSGVMRCAETFTHFTGTYNGKTHSCPPTSHDKAHNWYCGVAVANLNDHSQNKLAKFNF